MSTGEGVLFALCADGSMAKALDGSGIPGGWGIYRLSPGGDLETVYSIPNGGRAMAFWSDGDGTLFLLTEEKGAFLLTLLDVDTLTPVATQELFPAAEGAPHPQVFPQSDGSFCLLSVGATFWPCLTAGAAHGWWTLRRTPPSSPPWAAP